MTIKLLNYLILTTVLWARNLNRIPSAISPLKGDSHGNAARCQRRLMSSDNLDWLSKMQILLDLTAMWAVVREININH